MQSYSSIRPSPIAGSWYSNNPDDLSREINEYLKNAKVDPTNKHIFGLISPHAGYFYSGSTAGYAYRMVKGQSYDLCVVISPLHDYIPYSLLTSAHKAYKTPLGEIQVDWDLINDLNHQLEISKTEKLQPIANDREHSLEIQLPFLQIALAGPFQLLPIMVRTHDEKVLQETGNELAKCLKDKNVLLIASTDLSHFYTEETANQFDALMLKRFAGFDPEGVLEAEKKEIAFACGAGAVALTLWTAQYLGAKDVTVLHHTTSAEASGEKERVVGYGAAMITD
jgi:MEMO1 family protein